MQDDTSEEKAKTPSEENIYQPSRPGEVTTPSSPEVYEVPEAPSEPEEPELNDTPAAENEEEPEPAPQEATPEESTPKAVVPPAKQGSKLKQVLLGLLVLIVLGGLGYLGYKVANQKPVSITPITTVKKEVPLIRIGVEEGIVNSFYPTEKDFELTTFQINNQMYEGLVQFQDTSKIVPSLATSWTNPDESTWVFNLKQGVKFHNGHTMSAKDVKYSIEKYQATAFDSSFGFDLKEITAINDNQVKIVTAAPDPLLLHKLAYLMIVDSTAIKDGDPTVGTGPYQIKPGTTSSETKLDLVAFDGYHGGRPLTRELKWTSYSSEDELTNDTVAGNIDYAIAIDTVKNNDRLKKETKLILTSDSGIGVSAMGLNLNKKSSPLQNLKFRQALAAVIDRQAVIDASNLKAVPAYQVVTQAVPGFNASIKPGKPDLAKAKQLLAEAGYPNGASFSLVYSKDYASDQANSIARQLKQINVTVTLDPQDNFDSLSEKAFGGSGDAYFLSNTTDLLDASDVLATIFQTKNYTSPKLDGLLKQAGATLDSTKRLKNLEDASNLVIVDDVAEIPIYSRSDNTASDPSLVVHRDSYIGAYFWQVYRKG